jgi:hypothetical protein
MTTTKTKKNPQTNDRFRITVAIDVDSEHVGSILATFTKAGYTNLHCELITDELAFKSNKKRKVNSGNAKSGKNAHLTNGGLVLYVAAKHGRPFTSDNVRKVLADNKRSPHSAHPTLSDLVKQGLVRRLAAGKYKLTAKAAKKPKAVKPRLNGAAATEEAHG